MKQNALRRVAQGAVAGCVLQLALPALAVEPQQIAKLEPRPLTRAVEQKLNSVAASPMANFAQAADTTTSTDSRSFFKSPKGVATIVLMAVGVGYVVYTATNQRLDNPVR